MNSLLIGDVGSGKSMATAEQAEFLCKRSRRLQKRYKGKLPKRQILSNTVFSKAFTETYADILVYWEDPLQMIYTDWPVCKTIRRDFDVIWDEIANHIPSDGWKDLDRRVRKFFIRHRKRGVQIWANTLDYMMCDINYRRGLTHVYELWKIIGSPDPSPTLPPIKHPWGMIFKWRLDKKKLRIDDTNRVHVDIFPDILFITKHLIGIYDTTEETPDPENYYFQHKIKVCVDPNCKEGYGGKPYSKVIHT